MSTKLNQIMEIRKWYVTILLDLSEHPEENEIKKNENFIEVKAKVKEALEGDGEFDYEEARKDMQYMESFLYIT